MTYLEIIEELEQIKAILLSIKPVNLESRVQWTGLIGVAQDMRKNRKFEKLCATPIIGDTDYVNLPSYLVHKAKELEEHLTNTNNLKESAIAVELILECLEIWTDICPEVGYSTISDDIGKGNDIPMILVMKHHLYHTFIEYNLDEKLKKDTEILMEYVDSLIKIYC